MVDTGETVVDSVDFGATVVDVAIVAAVVKTAMVDTFFGTGVAVVNKVVVVDTFGVGLAEVESIATRTKQQTKAICVIHDFIKRLVIY